MPPLWPENKISFSHRKNRKTKFGPPLCESISGQRKNAPFMKSKIRHWLHAHKNGSELVRVANI